MELFIDRNLPLLSLSICKSVNLKMNEKNYVDFLSVAERLEKT